MAKFDEVMLCRLRLALRFNEELEFVHAQFMVEFSRPAASTSG